MIKDLRAKKLLAVEKVSKAITEFEKATGLKVIDIKIDPPKVDTDPTTRWDIKIITDLV